MYKVKNDKSHYDIMLKTANFASNDNDYSATTGPLVYNGWWKTVTLSALKPSTTSLPLQVPTIHS